MAAIEFRGVSKRYDDGTEAISDLDLRIEDGEFVILVGPSGCGKSTALRMIAGLEEITGGELLLEDEVINDVVPSDRDIAMVFQNYALYPHMTVRENMGFALRVAKVEKGEINRQVEAAAQALDLMEQLDRKPAHLSGGQRQRVAMGRAIVRNPKAFLMDEPLSNLDAKLRVQMRASVARLQRQLGTTMVYVTHDQTEAMTLGDRVAVLRGGVLQQFGTPAELYESPCNLFVAGFIGSPAMNFVPARIGDDVLELPFGTAPLTDALRAAAAEAGGRDAVAGLRPAHFEAASLVDPKLPRLRFGVELEVVESMGSELFAHFAYEGAAVEAEQLAELAADSGVDDVGRPEDRALVVARLDAEARSKAGDEIELALDTSKLLLFDAESGRRLGAAAAQPVAA
ncbi:Trehalose import ATP-binding protein SugC [Baekduia alba]|uniref:ABC transporter ATP-binding protein n=1 Tax=Baekduia alba TaxID=2997333 RepID=UPI002341E0EF|nr:sn-glycerol-3-phosphate ABC transporter ATP-binding protein UgpC [Baekduia alba]WCB95941.1 Trehalose import ATP-binding protein SugC [Baekduia alba]